MGSSKDGPGHGKLNGMIFFFFKLTRKRKRNAQVFVGGWMMMLIIIVGWLFRVFMTLSVFKGFAHMQQPLEVLGRRRQCFSPWRDQRSVV